MKWHFPQTQTSLSLWIWSLAVKMHVHRGQNQVNGKKSNCSTNSHSREVFPGLDSGNWRLCCSWPWPLPTSTITQGSSSEEMNSSLSSRRNWIKKTLPPGNHRLAPQCLLQGWNVGEDHANPISHGALGKHNARKNNPHATRDTD